LLPAVEIFPLIGGRKSCSLFGRISHPGVKYLRDQGEASRLIVLLWGIPDRLSRFRDGNSHADPSDIINVFTFLLKAILSVPYKSGCKR
jgi:hypothetical protein